MCLPAAGAGAAAAASTSTAMQAAGLAISAIGTVAGIAQAQASMQMQAQQARQQMDLQYRQAQEQAYTQNQQIIAKHKADIRTRNAAVDAYNRQNINNEQAASKTYMAEQQKLNEARQAAAFRSREIYAKQVGAVGSVLATGGTGQSIGALINDANRQAGFAQAKENATVDAATDQAGIAMDVASTKLESLNNQAYSQLPETIQAPMLAKKPTGIGKDLNLGIPSYDWS